MLESESIRLKKKEDPLFKFDHEPIAIWVSDRINKDIKKRWKIIVAFRNGDVKEIKLEKNP